ncbi:toll-like receptor 4 [Ostrea edulis]|uniref:toll-like receptor 4 n=1 Tax=Ostrea edulis TaxID=37623 RepID=UPI0024AF1AF7|nr:toll-like receptor 4 [Ostrea edulis]
MKCPKRMDHVFIILILLGVLIVSSSCCCSSKKCHCTHSIACHVMANCSEQNLKAVPKFDKNVTCIDLSGNNLEYISKQSFQGLKILHHLNLSYNTLKIVEEGAFRSLEKLTYLDISVNVNLGLAVLPNVTNGLNQTKIEVFKFEEISCPGGRSNVLRRHHLNNLNNTSLTELSIAGNRIEMFEPCVLYNLPKTIRKLSVANNRLIVGKYVLEYYSLVQLEILNASLRNRPAPFLESISSCYENPDPSSRHILDYNCHGNLSQSVWDEDPPRITISIPPKLHTVYVNSSKLYARVTSFGLKHNNLKRFYIQDNVIYSWFGPLHGVENVTVLDISKNFCSKLKKDIAKNLTGLLTLNVAHNALGPTFQWDITGKIFQNQRRLRFLDISYNRIQALPGAFMKNLINLVYLNVSNNLISEWNLKMRHMRKLTILDLSQNRLGSISKRSMRELDMLFGKGNLSIILKNNRLLCTCENLDFLEWMSINREHFMHHKTYTCLKTHQNTSNFDFKQLRKSVARLKTDCKSYTTIYIIVSVAVSSLFSLAVCIVVYRNRWKIRYLRYTLLQRNNGGYSRLQLTSADSFLYDAFVSYTSKDREFVTKEMIQKLEQMNGFRLLIRDRSFIPGESKSHQIVRSIQESRRAICVVSKKYLKSAWRDYELNMARVEGVEARKTLKYVILILLPEVYNGGYPKKISDFLKKNCFIEYPDDPAGYEEFWGNLCDVLHANNLE